MLKLRVFNSITKRWRWLNVIDIEGGSTPTFSVVEINGLVKDYDPPGGIDNCSGIYFDVLAKPWKPSTDYAFSNHLGGFGSSILPSGLDPVREFIPYMPAYILTDSVEPNWPTAPEPGEGTSETFECGNFKGDLIGYVEWAAEMSKPAAVWALIANNTLWVSSLLAGDTGNVEPDWEGASNYGDTVLDGDITWTNDGRRVFTWAPNTEFPIEVSDDGSIYFPAAILPIVPNGGYFDISSTTATRLPSSNIEPEWNAVPIESSAFVNDGKIIWREEAFEDKVVLTGLAAPSVPKSIIISGRGDEGGRAIKLIMADDVESEAGGEAASEEGNRFNKIDGNGANDADANYMLHLIYFDGAWRVPVPAS